METWELHLMNGVRTYVRTRCNLRKNVSGYSKSSSVRYATISHLAVKYRYS